MLELLVVGELERELADPLLDRGVGDVEDAVVVIHRAEHVGVLVEAAERAGTCRWADAPPASGLGAATPGCRRDSAAVDRERRIGGGALDDLAVGGVIPLVVRREAATGGGDVVDRERAVGADAVGLAALALDADGRGLERLVGERDVARAEDVVGGADVGLVAAVREVHPHVEFVVQFAVRIQLEPERVVGTDAGEELGRVPRPGALGVDARLAAGRGVAEHE
jgi:hypothetical protein